VDFSLLKRWPIRESSSLQLRADFFNLFNQATERFIKSGIEIKDVYGCL